jgi:hypothetical protein
MIIIQKVDLSDELYLENAQVAQLAGKNKYLVADVSSLKMHPQGAKLANMVVEGYVGVMSDGNLDGLGWKKKIYQFFTSNEVSLGQFSIMLSPKDGPLRFIARGVIDDITLTIDVTQPTILKYQIKFLVHPFAGKSQGINDAYWVSR